MKTLEQRFWAKVDRRPGLGPKGKCWMWMASRNPRGYGKVGREGKTYLAHRISYLFTYPRAQIKGRVVRHTCDNPACVRPKHLRLGTKKDNTQDAVRRGRLATGNRHGSRTCPSRVARGDCSGFRRHPEAYPRGEKCKRSKLTEEQVWRIYRDPRSYSQIIRDFPVNISQVSMIKNKKSWKHLHENS